MIERTIDEKQCPEQPWNRHESSENTLEQPNFLMAYGEMFHPHGKTNRCKENDADEDENAIELQWWIKNAGDKECDRTNQKNAQAVDEVTAHGTAGLDGVQAAMATDVSHAVGTAVGTTNHG